MPVERARAAIIFNPACPRCGWMLHMERPMHPTEVRTVRCGNTSLGCTWEGEASISLDWYIQQAIKEALANG